MLVHSPLVGPFIRSLVAEERGARGLSVAVPTLPEDQRPPYWRRHAEAVADQVAGAGSPPVLVGHSGACPLLPAIGMAIGGAVSAYVLVDGDLPFAPGTGGSRVDQLRTASPALADELVALLTAGGRFPTWGDEDLREEISDQRLRARVVAEVRPQPREFWAEALPAIPCWRTRPAAISNSVPTMRRPPLARGAKDGDTATSPADTSRCSCGRPPSPTRSSSYGFDSAGRPLASVLAPRPRHGAETDGIRASRAASPGCLGWS